MTVSAQQGQTWDVLAKIYLGDEYEAKQIMLINPELADVTVFEGGENVMIPEEDND